MAIAKFRVELLLGLIQLLRVAALHGKGEEAVLRAIGEIADDIINDLMTVLG